MKKSRLRQWLLRRGGGGAGDDCITFRCSLTVIREPRTEDLTAVAVPPSDMRRYMANMLRDGDGADVVVVVQDQQFPAHGCMLAARSPVFRAELFGAGHMKERRTSCIVIDDMEPSIFSTFLHFIYTDSLPDSSDDTSDDQDYMACTAFDMTRPAIPFLSMPPMANSSTSSRCLTASVTGTHYFEMTSYSLLEGMGTSKFVSSTTFSVAGYDWNLRFYPDGLADGYVSASLHLVGTTTGSMPIRVRFLLSLLNGYASTLLGMSRGLTHTFERAGSDCRIPMFVKKRDLQGHAIGRIRLSGNDSVKIECSLTVIRDYRAEDVSMIPVPPSNLHQHLAGMLQGGEIADVEFSVGGEPFRAHACVLAARSPVFKAELLGPAAADGSASARSIKIDDMEPATLKELLHFIYTDHLPNDSGFSEEAALQRRRSAGGCRSLWGGQAEGDAKLCESINVETVVDSLEFAEKHHCAQLKDACLGLMASPNVLGVIRQTDGFKRLVEGCPSVMKEILDKIDYDNMEPSIFSTFLHFMYTDSLPDSSDDTPDDQDYMALHHLMVAADRYGLDRLVLICEEKLCRSIGVTTVATTLALAEQHQRKVLKDACLGFIVSRDVLGAVARTDGLPFLAPPPTPAAVSGDLVGAASAIRERNSGDPFPTRAILPESG
uniref:BTB domain-containing protein n=1 Tax=Oryza punctata TaxID=4537 RepID=A0A0E0KVI0_ORYPU